MYIINHKYVMDNDIGLNELEFAHWGIARHIVAR